MIFLKATKNKLIIFVILLLFFNLLSTRYQSRIFYFYHDYYKKPYLMTGGVTGCEYRGLPLTTISKCCGDEIKEPCKIEFYYLDLVINIIFFYFFSCFLIWIFNKLKLFLKK